MDKRKKIKKLIGSIELQQKKHREKIDDYEGKDYTLIPYWEKEIEQLEKKKREYIDKLDKS